MNPRQLHAEMDRFQHALADLPPDVREVIELHYRRVVAAYLGEQAANEALLRLISEQQRPLARMIRERSAN